MTWPPPDDGGDAEPLVTEVTRPPRNRTLWTAGWTLLAAGVLLGGGGGALVGVDGVETGDEQITTRGREVEVLNTDVSGWVLLGVGGAALATGVILLVLSSRGDSSREETARLIRRSSVEF